MGGGGMRVQFWIQAWNLVLELLPLTISGRLEVSWLL